MNHIDQHTIELYILGAPEVADRQEQIERHLGECLGCRDLANEMREYYEALSEELEHPLPETRPFPTSLVKPKADVPVYEGPFTEEVPVPRSVSLSYFTYFVRKHPVGATVGSFGLAAALAAVLFLSSPGKDQRPSYVNYNPATGTAEILNKKYELLWQFKAEDMEERIKQEMNNRVKLTQLHDLNHDGLNEVLTSLPKYSDAPALVSSLSIFSADGDLTKRVDFSHEVAYDGRVYSPNFEISGFVIRDDDKSGEAEIFLTTTNNGRSPCMVVRMQPNGEVLGRYWHFGHLIGIYLKDINGDGKTELILTGINDVNDDIDASFPTLGVLDPSRIIGDRRSTNCPRYRLDVSDAEIAYYNFPKSDLDSTLHVTSMATNIVEEDESAIRVNVVSPPNKEGQYSVEYYLNNELKLVRVKSTDATNSLRKRLADAGRLKISTEQAFVRELFDRVLYWDGRAWSKSPVRVSIPVE